METKFEYELQSKGQIVFVTEGDSMMPMLHQHKDVVVIKSVAEPIKKYDVVLFKRPTGEYVLHRVIKCCGCGEYKIAGDNRAFSEIVPEGWIIGILSEIIRDGIHIAAHSPEYKAYTKKLPLRRFKLKVKRYLSAIKRRLKKH